MEQYFDTYKEHTTFYKICNFFLLFFFLQLILLFIFNKTLSNLSNTLQTIFMTIFIISLTFFLIGWFLIMIPSNILMYKKDGELELKENEIIINFYSYDTMSYKFEFKVIGYRGQGGSKAGKDGMGNKVKIYKENNIIIEKQFVIATKSQYDYLIQILDVWKKQKILH